MPVTTVTEYILKHENRKAELELLRDICLQSELKENIKWGAPVYSYKKRNLIGLASFKHHFGVWLFEGALIKKHTKYLSNAQEGKTQAMRQIRYESIDDVDVTILKNIIEENKALFEKGAKLPKKKIEVIIPDLLKTELEKSDLLQANFEKLSPGKQRDYCEHIASAKQEKTKQSRLEKSIALIKEGKGLHDKYKNC